MIYWFLCAFHHVGILTETPSRLCSCYVPELYSEGKRFEYRTGCLLS
jgi:hypothetical protein